MLRIGRGDWRGCVLVGGDWWGRAPPYRICAEWGAGQILGEVATRMARPARPLRGAFRDDPMPSG